jgi:hypothetical protein
VIKLSDVFSRFSFAFFFRRPAQWPLTTLPSLSYKIDFPATHYIPPLTHSHSINAVTKDTFVKIAIFMVGSNIAIRIALELSPLK